MRSIASLARTTLPIPPSCIAFLPKCPSCFVVGTYLLHKSPDTNPPTEQQRTGSLMLFTFSDSAQEAVTEVLTVKTDFAVLDIAFSPHLPQVLVACTSNGRLAFYHTSNSYVKPLLELTICHHSILVLDLQFHLQDKSCIAVALSDGRVCTVRLSQNILDFLAADSPVGQPTCSMLDAFLLQEITKHELEAWTIAFAADSQGIYTGGDDGQLRYAGLENDKAISPWSDRRLHAAGVTAVLPLPPSPIMQEPVILTGSYDDHIRVIAPPNGQDRRVPTLLAELDLGGGVWRLELIDYTPQTRTYRILASCMHAGARILSVFQAGSDADHGSQGEWKINVDAGFTEHESMNYASAVQPLDSPHDVSRSQTVVSTSFYDRLMCVWSMGLAESST